MYDNETRSFLYPSSVGGEVSNDYYGSYKEGIHGYSYKRLYNLKVNSDNSVSTRTGRNYLNSYDHIPFLSECGNGGVVLSKEGIEVYDVIYPFTKTVTKYPTSFPLFDDIRSISTIMYSSAKVIILVKTDTASYYLDLTYKDGVSTISFQLIQQEDSNGTLTNFIPTDIILEYGRAFAIYENYMLITDIGNTTIFKNNQNVTNPSLGFKYYPEIQTTDVNLLDIILSQNHLFIGTNTSYICLDVNINATTTSEVFVQYKVSKQFTKTKKFIEMGGEVLSIGDTYIDVLRFENFNNTIKYHPISSTVNYILDGRPINKIATRFYQSSLVVYIIKGSSMYRLTTIVNNNNIPISLGSSVYYPTPFTKEYQNAFYVNFSSSNLLNLTKYQNVYYLTINPTVEDNTNGIKLLTVQDTSIYDDQFKKTIEHSDYLDYSKSNNTLTPYLCEVYTTNQILSRKKVTNTTIQVGKTLLLQYNNIHGIITYYKAIVLKIEDDIEGTIITLDFDYSTIQTVDSITGDKAPFSTRIVGCLTNNVPTDIDYLDVFYHSRFVYVKYMNDQGVFESKQLLSRNDLIDMRLDQTVYCRIGVAYRSYLEILPSFDGRANVIPTGLKAVISNATKTKLFTLTLTDMVDGVNNIDILSYLKNYSDYELLGTKVLYQPAITFLPKLYELHFSSPTSTNITFSNMYIGSALCYSFKVHSYILVGS